MLNKVMRKKDRNSLVRSLLNTKDVVCRLLVMVVRLGELSAVYSVQLECPLAPDDDSRSATSLNCCDFQASGKDLKRLLNFMGHLSDTIDSEIGSTADQ